MTANDLAGFAGVLLSAGFMYLPGLRTSYAAMAEEKKSLIMAICILIIGILIIASSCFNLWIIIACTKVSLLEFGRLVGIALVLNQGTYSILPQPADVKAVKALRQ